MQLRYITYVYSCKHRWRVGFFTSGAAILI